ncbi:MAG: serine hydrolase [Salibacteraceae bacterium]
MIKLKLLSFTAALLFQVFVLKAQREAEDFEAFARETAAKFELPSMAVIIVKDNMVVSSFGVGNKSEMEPDENTLYAIASLSKAFTSVSIGMLVDEEKLDWEDKVIDHLPWFKMHDTYVTQNMTIEDLLAHRSGLETFDGDLLWYGSNYTREEAVKRIQYRVPSNGFRDEFGYQNLMYMTAGEVIEEVTGATWDEFVKTRILEPLQMNSTTSSFDQFSRSENIAKPHIDGDEIPMLSYDNSGATASLNSSTGDMTSWMRFWLNNGVYNDVTLLSEDAINKLWSMHTPLSLGAFDKANNSHFKGYGLGWFLMDYNGRKVIHHGGGLPGYITKIALVPEESLGIVILTNDMTSVPTLMMYAAIDWAMDNDFQVWQETFLRFKENAAKREEDQKQQRLKTKMETPQLLEISKYAGVYEDELYGKAEIKLDNDGLRMKLLPAAALFSGRLTPWSDHAFRFDHNDPFLTYGIVKFIVNSNDVDGFTIDLPNYDFHFDKLAFKRID